ncbi:unnamed protein product [Cuscuta europaea]|uniref:Uncharacterized protein n=1 Tax=Cuscuta europaea TaxID=41803 RepID=A0A9P0YTK9_CUSEU|nr:unnamed protein product [Cuscuta europaea]
MRSSCASGAGPVEKVAPVDIDRATMPNGPICVTVERGGYTAMEAGALPTSANDMVSVKEVDVGFMTTEENQNPMSLMSCEYLEHLQCKGVISYTPLRMGPIFYLTIFMYRTHIFPNLFSFSFF